tara:strand:+ start:104 stop:532 length:429 start_codon:yes stop_codon:yes gene_type:complete
MSNNIIDYDPLQEKIRSALSRASAVVRDLEAVMPYMPNTCQSLIGTIVEELQNGGALQRTVARDLEHVIDHVEREITCGERHEIVADEHYAQGTYSQIVYTREAEVLRERLPRLRQMQDNINQVHYINAAEALAHEMRAGRR